MKNKIILTLTLLSFNVSFSQIGINTTAPTADFHLKSINNTSPVLIVKQNENSTPILHITDSKHIGINTVSNNDATIKIDSKTLGDSGIKLSNSNNLVKKSGLNDLSIDIDGFVTTRGNDIGKIFIAFKTNDTRELNATDGFQTDSDLVLNLPKGKYLITGTLIYYSGTNNDIEVKLFASGDATGKYNFLGHYGTFTTEITAVPYFTQNFNSNNPVSIGGVGVGNDKKIGANLNAVLTVNSNSTKVTIQYKQQAGIVATDTKFFKNSFIKAVKIQ